MLAMGALLLGPSQRSSLTLGEYRKLMQTLFFGGCSRIALLNPPSSSSLAEEQRLRSLLLTTAARDSRRSQPAGLKKMLSYGRPRLR